MINNELIRQMKEYLPPVFAATKLDELTGNAIRWATIQNQRSKSRTAGNYDIPVECFLNDGSRKIIIVRDPFLEWWSDRIGRL